MSIEEAYTKKIYRIYKIKFELARYVQPKHYNEVKVCQKNNYNRSLILTS